MRRVVLVALPLSLLLVRTAAADYTKNIMITGYWAPTNEMVRRFSTDPDKNPNGWIGGNWEGRGYNIYSFFPEFRDQNDLIGYGDFEVDYQDTSADWWRIANQVKPVAIITFSRGSAGSNWELEFRQRNRVNWVPDYRAPNTPNPSPPDPNHVPVGSRYSTLPYDKIASEVNKAGLGISAFVDKYGDGGGFLSEYIAYHGTWYQGLHSDPNDPAWSVAAGHIHVGINTPLDRAQLATDISLRELIKHVDSIVPEPAALGWLMVALLGIRRPRG